MVTENRIDIDGGGSVAFVPQEPEYGVLEITQDDLIAKSYAYVYLDIPRVIELRDQLNDFIEGYDYEQG